MCLSSHPGCEQRLVSWEDTALCVQRDSACEGSQRWHCGMHRTDRRTPWHPSEPADVWRAELAWWTSWGKCHTQTSSLHDIACDYAVASPLHTTSTFNDEVRSVTEALVLRPLLEDWGRITESIRILLPVDRMKQKCFQIMTKQVCRSQQFQLIVQHRLSDFRHGIHHFFPSTSPLTLILPTHGGMARLSWPG